MTDLGTELPRLAALPDREAALTRLVGLWRSSEDRDTFASLVQGLLAWPEGHPVVPLLLDLSARCPDLDVEVELQALWDSWSDQDLRTRAALARAIARRLHQSPEWCSSFQRHALLRPELGELLVPLFLADPDWFEQNAKALFTAYPQARLPVLAAAELLLDAAPAASERPSDASRELLGRLLDYDAAEVFSKLDAMLDAAPELGEALLLEMAARRMDLRGVVAALAARVERTRLKSWLQAAVEDELELLVYLAMI